MYKVLIVEDDLTIAKLLKESLNKWKYEVKYITEFKNVLEEFVDYIPQLVLLDISLPFFNGYYWCSEIRKISKVPIIFISSANENMNIIMAINMGADDFIAKPFSLDVIVAKVQALIRRTYSFQGQVNIIEHNGVILSLNDNTLIYNSNKLELTKNDFKILQILFENAGNIVNRNDIIIRLWENDNFIDDNTLTVNITRIRKKLNDIGLKDFILTKKGIGYSLNKVIT